MILHSLLSAAYNLSDSLRQDQNEITPPLGTDTPATDAIA